MQINLNHCEAAHDLLMQSARELKLDMILISEPYKHLDSASWISSEDGKVAIWVCGTNSFQSANKITNSGFVKVKVNGIHFYSCYAPPSQSLDEFNVLLDALVEDVQNSFPVAIAGDFNAWATDWGSKTTNAKGCALVEAMSTIDVVLLNTGDKPTFVRGEASSIVDVTFVSSILAKRNISWNVAEVYTGSDHQALCWEVSNHQAKRRKVGIKPIDRGWRVSTFDPELFKLALDDHPTQSNNPSEMASDTIKKVTTACDATMPRRRNKNLLPPVYWWNDNIAYLRKKCIRTRRRSQRCRKTPHFEQLYKIYKEARLMLNKAIKESKRSLWTKMLEDIEGDPWGRPYKVVMKKLKNHRILSPTDPIVMKEIVTVLFPQQAKVEYSMVLHANEFIPPVSQKEVMDACNRIENTKAPGLDGIPNVALKEAIKTIPKIFVDTYNACLQKSTFPTIWKRQRLVLLPKTNRPLNDPSSYRPLCMLDTAGKILERIIHGRIEKVIEPLLSEYQYGFRKGKSTIDAVDLVLNTARKAIAGTRWKRGSKKYCLVATLDIKNAFNTVKWEVIMNSLLKMKVPAYLRNIISSYFTDRVLIYNTDDGPKKYTITGGVPQGSVLGPLLWNVMYDGLLKCEVPCEARLVAFADDLAVIVVAKHLEEVNWTFDKTFQIIRRWMDLAGLQLAEHKTEAVLITSRKQIETTSLRVGNYELTTQPYIRYLGIMIDTRINLQKHIEHAAAKGAVVSKTLARLMPNVGGPKQNRRRLLASVVTSVLLYGAPLWSDALKKQLARRKMVSVYRMSALRVASAFRTVSVEAVCVISGMIPLEILTEERMNLYLYKRANTDLPLTEVKNNERRKSIERWQLMWDTSNKGRWTYRLITKIEPWYNRKHGETNYYLTQMLSGHGCYRDYLHRFKHEDAPECPGCSGMRENAEHVFFECPTYKEARDVWYAKVGRQVYPENIVEIMLSGISNWEATSEFAQNVLKDLRRKEQARKE